MTQAAGTKTKALCVATPCMSVDQFVATFHKYCDESTIFVATLASRPIGLETAFSIELADRTPVLQGLCEIVGAWGTPANPFGRPGIRLQIRRLTRPSVDVFQRLRARRVAEARPPADGAAAQAKTPPPAHGALPKIPLPPLPPGAEKPAEKPAGPPVPETVVRTPSASSGVPVELPAVSIHNPESQIIAASTNPYPFVAKVAPAAPTPPAATPVVPAATPKLPAWAMKHTPPTPVITIMPHARGAAAAPEAVEPEVPTVVRDLQRAAKEIEDAEVPTVVREAPPAVVARAKPKPSAADIAREAAETAAAKLRAMAAESIARSTPHEEATSESPAPVFALEPAPLPDPTPPPPPAPDEVPPALSRTTTDAAFAALQQTDPRPVEIAAPPEGERVPGSELVLPANPLMNLTDDSLQGFIDCTLYEETGNFFAPPDASEADGDAVTQPPGPRYPSLIGLESLEAISEPLVFDPPPNARPVTPLPIPNEIVQGAIDSKPVPTGPAPAESDDVAVIVAPPIVAEHLPSRSPPSPPPAAGSLRARALKWWPIGAGAAVLGVVIGLIAVLVTGSSASNKNPPPVRSAAPAPPPVAPVQPAAGSDAEEPPPPGGAPPVVGKGPCRVIVLSTPAGSTVQVDGQAVGPSPISIDGPCQKKRIDVVHARYAPVQRFVEPAPGKPEQLDVTLERPTHAVMVVTHPPGATISIDGRRAGVSPTVIQVMGFQPMRLTAEKSGFKTATVNLYSRAPRDRVSIPLDRSLFPPKK